MKLPFYSFTGNPYEIGYRHGFELKERIHRTIKFYKGTFNKPDQLILEKARNFEDKIKSFNQDYAIEIEAIAKGAEVDPLWIYALNARSEILNLFRPECTAIYTAKNGILAQNWDWAGPLEDLAVVVKITRTHDEPAKPPHSILMVTEPGIIGKIGLNSFGLGVTLNFLKVNFDLHGIPIHIMLRALLDQTSIEKGIALIKQWVGGQSGNIIYGSHSGEYVNFEFTGNDVLVSSGDPFFIHTNHFLQKPELNDAIDTIDNTIARYSRASDLANLSSLTIETIKSILLDKENSEWPICRQYMPDEQLGTLGTVCSIIMDLNKRKMLLTRGNPHEYPFEEILLETTST